MINTIFEIQVEKIDNTKEVHSHLVYDLQDDMEFAFDCAKCDNVFRVTMIDNYTGEIMFESINRAVEILSPSLWAILSIER